MPSPSYKDEKRKRFIQILEQFKGNPFPLGPSGNKDLQNAHDTMILYKTEASDVASSLLDNSTLSEEKKQQLLNLLADYRIEGSLENMNRAFPRTDPVGKLSREHISYYYEIRKLLYSANAYLLSTGANIPDWQAVETYREWADPAKPILRSALAGEREIPQQKPYVEALLCLALKGYQRLLTLEEVIESADAINHGIVSPDEISWAFLRMRERGWLLIQNDLYGLTSDGRREIEGIVHGLNFWNSFDSLKKWTVEHSPPSAEK